MNDSEPNRSGSANVSRSSSRRQSMSGSVMQQRSNNNLATPTFQKSATFQIPKAQELWGRLREHLRRGRLRRDFNNAAQTITAVELPRFCLGDTLPVPSFTPAIMVKKYLDQAPIAHGTRQMVAILSHEHSLGFYSSSFWYVLVSQFRPEAQVRYLEALFLNMSYHYGVLFSDVFRNMGPEATVTFAEAIAGCVVLLFIIAFPGNAEKMGKPFQKLLERNFMFWVTGKSTQDTTTIEEELGEEQFRKGQQAPRTTSPTNGGPSNNSSEPNKEKRPRMVTDHDRRWQRYNQWVAQDVDGNIPTTTTTISGTSRSRSPQVGGAPSQQQARDDPSSPTTKQPLHSRAQMFALNRRKEDEIQDFSELGKMVHIPDMSQQARAGGSFSDHAATSELGSAFRPHEEDKEEEEQEEEASTGSSPNGSGGMKAKAKTSKSVVAALRNRISNRTSELSHLRTDGVNIGGHLWKPQNGGPAYSMSINSVSPLLRTVLQSCLDQQSEEESRHFKRRASSVSSATDFLQSSGLLSSGILSNTSDSDAVGASSSVASPKRRPSSALARGSTVNQLSKILSDSDAVFEETLIGTAPDPTAEMSFVVTGGGKGTAASVSSLSKTAVQLRNKLPKCACGVELSIYHDKNGGSLKNHSCSKCAKSAAVGNTHRILFCDACERTWCRVCIKDVSGTECRDVSTAHLLDQILDLDTLLTQDPTAKIVFGDTLAKEVFAPEQQAGKFKRGVRKVRLGLKAKLGFASSSAFSRDSVTSEVFGQDAKKDDVPPQTTKQKEYRQQMENLLNMSEERVDRQLKEEDNEADDAIRMMLDHLEGGDSPPRSDRTETDCSRPPLARRVQTGATNTNSRPPSAGLNRSATSVQSQSRPSSAASQRGTRCVGSYTLKSVLVEEQEKRAGEQHTFDEGMGHNTSGTSEATSSHGRPVSATSRRAMTPLSFDCKDRIPSVGHMFVTSSKQTVPDEEVSAQELEQQQAKSRRSVAADVVSNLQQQRRSTSACIQIAKKYQRVGAERSLAKTSTAAAGGVGSIKRPLSAQMRRTGAVNPTSQLQFAQRRSGRVTMVDTRYQRESPNLSYTQQSNIIVDRVEKLKEEMKQIDADQRKADVEYDHAQARLAICHMQNMANAHKAANNVTKKVVQDTMAIVIEAMEGTTHKGDALDEIDAVKEALICIRRHFAEIPLLMRQPVMDFVVQQRRRLTKAITDYKIRNRDSRAQWPPSLSDPYRTRKLDNIQQQEQLRRGRKNKKGLPSRARRYSLDDEFDPDLAADLDHVFGSEPDANPAVTPTSKCKPLSAKFGSGYRRGSQSPTANTTQKVETTEDAPLVDISCVKEDRGGKFSIDVDAYNAFEQELQTHLHSPDNPLSGASSPFGAGSPRGGAAGRPALWHKAAAANTNNASSPTTNNAPVPNLFSSIANVARLTGWKKSAQKNLEFHVNGEEVDSLITTFYEKRKPKMQTRVTKTREQMVAEDEQSREERERFLQEKLGLEREDVGNGLYKMGQGLYWHKTGKPIGGSAEEYRAKTFNKRQDKSSVA